MERTLSCLHVSGLAGNLDEVAVVKRLLHAEEDAGQEILGDVAKGDTQHQPDQARSADHRQGQLRQAGHPENDIDAGEQHEDRRRPGEDVAKQSRAHPLLEEPSNAIHREPACRDRQAEHAEAENHEGQGPDQIMGEFGDAFLSCREVPDAGADDLHAIGYGDDALHVSGEIGGPLLQFVGPCLT